ncbi:Methyltransferase domain [Candidatus Nitrososphaera evergladensis SR1]|uniref:Methyltransferase domain n=1 Tax=Candidatus Nitrososphaera evergladensis SR1 TaxID=1459636 RepID=A0A075MV62_9ARCH|nr:methyltransferase [Candidatus Nitrososphaera evergladensis]AIF83169.1 Methyltransferase domain [Candidatus Nitrososphaera evergladensis SR1]
MYVPAEDTLFLVECAKHYRGTWALEIGIGSGAVAQSLLANFTNVVGTDIDLASLGYCRGKCMMLVCCDAASALCGKFDLVVTNPPYLPGDPRVDTTIHGGPAGMETTIRFIESALPLLSEKEGRMLAIVSSLADSATLDKFVREKRLKKKVVAEKALFYERLYAIELTF